MQVSELDADTNFLCGSTSGTYLRVDKRRNQNIEYQRIATLIWDSDSTWNYDDSNNTNSPVAYRTVANASASYLVPTTAIRIEGVEIKDNGGNWTKLKPITYHELPVAPDAYFTAVGLPMQYMLQGNEIRLFPPPGTNNVTMSSGMAVRLSRAVTELGVSATSTTPGFATPFHRMLSFAASIDFVQDNQQKQFLMLQKDRLEKGLIKFYSHRADDFPGRLNPRTKTYNRQWL